MLEFEPLTSATSWKENDASRTLFHSQPWMDFLKATQKGEPVFAELRKSGATVGYFTGMIVRKFGMKILGSPFPGWSTSYMGFNLGPGVCKRSALDALKRVAFDELRCSHLEFMDRNFSEEEIQECGLQWTPFNGFEVDLSADEDAIYHKLSPSCRHAIRKAARSGVTVEEAQDSSFVDEYYEQLIDVFAKQSLVPTYGIDRVHALLQHIRPTGNLMLLRARNGEGASIATGIFLLISPTTMYFWGGASWRSHQYLRPNDLLMWTAMRLGKARGMRALDLGGSGDYKRKFGGRPICVPWARVSAQRFIPILRNTARTLFKVRQRLQASAHWAMGRQDPVVRG